MGNLFSEIKMKRTAQRFDKPGQNIPEHTSGCRQFEGEDLMYNERIKRNAQNQRDWADQQIREKNQKNCQEKEDDRMYAMQTEAITRMRGMLEDEASQKKNQMMKDMQAYNKQLALEKKRREQAWKEDQQCQDKAETTLTDHHEKMNADGKIAREDVF